MDGADSDPNNRPMTGTGMVTINILDISDNIPTLENVSYEASVEENIKNKKVIRIKTIDKNKEYTENWEAVYTIISGNEAGYFNITAGPKTNEGILMVTKELNYEEFKEISLKVVVNNKAAYQKSVVKDKIIEYPIKIKVQNVHEAPHFQPAVKDVRVSEDREVIDL
ncbi:desmoglein-2-like protein [Hemibagrus wyckioides]|nr:desmoglein-2-like protein [Hemibagrus wyckioides]